MDEGCLYKGFRDLGLSFWGLGCRVRALGIAFAGFAGSSAVWSDTNNG